MQSCVHSFFFFFLPDGPTHLHKREGDGKRNILLGWPYIGDNGIIVRAITKISSSQVYVIRRQEIE